MSLIDKLTPKQEALILVYREKWRAIALSTKRIDQGIKVFFIYFFL
ncbi:hypothetical protein [Halotia branconii]|uniref:Uncharacterized protein n=1 Tax=Halotia branconii CENA392 TaxID=1539056 RepID=A0AAJ6P9B4_9CYAN|nr:hypothetical protein [Halotia branconii]WGV25512.1 hypothetical protein QI031_27910 [Halotia branconii CENA392]